MLPYVSCSIIHSGWVEGFLLPIMLAWAIQKVGSNQPFHSKELSMLDAIGAFYLSLIFSNLLMMCLGVFSLSLSFFLSYNKM